MSAYNGEDAFVIYHEGVALKLQWSGERPISVPVLRVCALEASQLLVLTADECLYSARLNADFTELQLKLERKDVQDIGFCRKTRQLFIVTKEGEVLLQELIDTASSLLFDNRTNAWQRLSFDPLELSEQGICIEKVCCAAASAIFIAHGRRKLYAFGNCGAVFAAETQPKNLRLFENEENHQNEILDIAAGDEFYVVLRQRVYDEKKDTLNLSCNSAGTSKQVPSPRLSRQETFEIEFTDEDRQQELHSNSSFISYSSSKSHDDAPSLEQILRHGYALIHTQVFTFGTANNGLLGTGDHMKRSRLQNIQKLDGVGVCSVTAGREHTVARTFDGRLYHWGINSKQQLNDNKNESHTDLSAPTEVKLDHSELSSEQRIILANCCGDFQTVLLNLRGELIENSKLITLNQRFLTLQMCGSTTTSTAKRPCSLLLAAGKFTVHNCCPLPPQHFHQLYCNLQTQISTLLNNRKTIQMLQNWQQKRTATVLKSLQPLCQSYLKIICLEAAFLYSLQCFYHGYFLNPFDLVFIKQYRECIMQFEAYTKMYCSLYAVDGFTELEKFLLINHSAYNSSHAKCNAHLFQQPLQLCTQLVHFLELLFKSSSTFNEPLIAWQTYARQQHIDMELAEYTQEFWERNGRNSKLRHLRHPQRRVILTCAKVPLKLVSGALSMSSPTFVLFSDCFCQISGNQLQTYPLVVVWPKNVDTEQSLRIVTPERSFTVLARTPHDRKLWYDQLETSIKAALGRPDTDKLSTVRTAAYVFSRSHAKYSSVHAIGRWRNGVLHGNCYLEYPDGRIYFGEIRNGEIEGYGKMVIPSVGLYEGSFHMGKFHGQGIYEMKEGEMYEGNFVNGLFHGHGTLRSNSYTYVGEYQANLRSGYGILDDMMTGDKYMGMFAENRRTGAGTCISMNGDYFEGIFTHDQLTGTGIAVFENDYYYEGELTMNGPSGRGTYYMPTTLIDGEETEFDEFNPKRQLLGNVLSGQLSGNWHDVRVVSGSVAINRQFPKYPGAIGQLVVDNSRKWRALFENFEEQLYGLQPNREKPEFSITMNATKYLWSRIAVFMTTKREREKRFDQQQQDSAYQSNNSYFARNIALGFASQTNNYHDNSLDQISLKSTNSLFTTGGKSSIVDLRSGSCSFGPTPARAHSQETLYDAADFGDVDFMSTFNFPFSSHNEEHAFNGYFNAQLNTWATDSNDSLRSSFESVLNLSGSINNQSLSKQSELDFVPSFGITPPLSDADFNDIKDYLTKAFKNHLHPLCLLNQRIANCFYSSYGCWKVKPTALLAKQAMREWESIAKRVYKFVRKMFPALPEDYCVLELQHEIVSHITLLYPIVLSEGIYSTLFVLYANKYSRKDEMYRQNLLLAEKLRDDELMQVLGLDSALLPVVSSAQFDVAIDTLRQLQEKYSPKAMLTVIENCMQRITEAHKTLENENPVIIAADSMMPLTLFLILRAAVPHLGAELSLLDDLTGSGNYHYEMNGIAGYCYTTLKASYEHITSKPLSKTH